MTTPIPADWQPILEEQTSQPYYARLQEFVARERAEHTVYPPAPEVYQALELTPFARARVLLLGQDPYPGAGQAHGLCFSVRPGVPQPRSLRNIFTELHNDVGVPAPNHGYLAHWAEQGILMLNAVLTVRAGQPNSHKRQGWETFTDAIIAALSARATPVVFVLWGGYAQKKRALIDTSRHAVVESAHPSPLSASHGFLGSRPFSRVDAALHAAGQPPIDWAIPNL